MIYIENNPPERIQSDAAYYLASEEFLLNNYTSDEYLMLWKSPPTVVVGKFQNAYSEASIPEIMRRGIALVRRNSGGGTVYHDYGNLNFTMIANRAENSLNYDRFLSPVVAALNSLGVPAMPGTSFDITIHGKKISGNAQSATKSRVMHHGTLLFDSDLSILSEITGHANAAVKSKAIQSNPSPVCNIRPYLAADMNIDTFAENLKISICGKNPTIHTLTMAEIAEIIRIADSKYRTWEWNFAKSPSFTKNCGSFTIEVIAGILTSITPSLPIPIPLPLPLIPSSLPLPLITLLLK